MVKKNIKSKKEKEKEKEKNKNKNNEIYYFMSLLQYKHRVCTL